MKRLVLVDDHAIVLQGLRALLEMEPDFEVAGETGDGKGAIDLVERLKPDVVVMDAAMPDLNGIEAASRIKSWFPNTRVIILTMHSDESYVSRALKCGADGYVLKRETATKLVEAIRTVLSGKRYLSPPLSEKLLDASGPDSMSDTIKNLEVLTPREREIMQLAAEGYSNSAIGKRLFISPRTVETHRSRVTHKLGLKSQTELVLYAIRTGIVDANTAQLGANKRSKASDIDTRPS